MLPLSFVLRLVTLLQASSAGLLLSASFYSPQSFRHRSIITIFKMASSTTPRTGFNTDLKFFGFMITLITHQNPMTVTRPAFSENRSVHDEMTQAGFNRFCYLKHLTVPLLLLLVNRSPQTLKQRSYSSPTIAVRRGPFR